MRIAQITFHNAQNCGAMLQAWALQQYLKHNGHDCFLVDCPENQIGAYEGHFCHFDPQEDSLLKIAKYCGWYILNGLLSYGTDDLKRIRFKKFKHKHLTYRKISPHEIENAADVAIFGSDQIWNHDLCGTSFEYFLGKSIKLPKIGYGISVGDNNVADGDLAQIRAAAATFESLSFRELFQQDTQDKHNRPIATVSDPTLLATREDYLRIAHKKIRKFQNNYILVFNLMNVMPMESLGREIALKLGLHCVIINMTQHGLWRKRKGTFLAISPDRLLAYIRDAKYVLTDSFHGTVLSTILKKQFLSYSARRDLPNGRIANFLSLVGEGCRTCCPDTTIAKAVEKITSPLAPSAQEQLSTLQNKSKKWLDDSLKEIEHAITER